MTTEIPDDYVSLPPQVAGLLNHTRGLVGHEREIERATASRFNLFHILGVGHYEVSTHSALIADLLSPQGSHGQGAVFLKRFIEMPSISSAPGFPREFDAESAKVQCEVSIGAKTETDGGRIDILVKDKSNRWKIAIENKIHAGEQENWVERYLNFLQDDGCLLYLTKFGDKPTQIASDELSSRVQCISYSVTVKDWLETCRKEAAMVPIVRESLTQYIHLINDITHQNRDTRMNNQIVKSVLNDAESFDAYCALRDANRPIKKHIIMNFGERIRTRVPAGFDLVATPKGSCAQHDGFKFLTSALKPFNVQVVVSFDSPDYGNCYYGFELIDASIPFQNSAGELETLSKCFSSVFGLAPLSSGRWPAWGHCKVRNWNDEVLRQIHFEGSSFDDEFIELLNQLMEAATQFVREVKPRSPDVGG